MNGDIIPEFRCNEYLNVKDVSKLYKLTKDGKEVLRGIYDENLKEFIRVD